MSYPHIILNKPIRRAFMLFLIVVFFISAPLLLAYTSGYRYDFAIREVRQTGVISIDVEPTDVTVELNGIVIQKKMPLRLSNRAPGTYHLRITKDGYQPWEKDITVSSKQTTYIRGVTLFRQASPTALPNDMPITVPDATVSETGTYILVRHSDGVSYAISLINTKTKVSSVIKQGDTATEPTIIWSPRQELALLLSKNNDSTKAELLDPALGRIVYTQIITPPPTGTIYQWNVDDRSPSVWLRDKDEVFLASENGRTTSISLPPLTDIWFRDANNTLWTHDRENNLIISDDNHETQYAVDDTISRIVDINNNRILIDNGDHHTIISRHDQQRQSLQATHTRLNPFTGEWNVWSESELWTVYPDGSMTLLNRTGEQIKDVYPLDPYGVLLLSTGKGLIGFNPGYYVTHELLNKSSASPIGVNQDQRIIYFVDTTENTVYELPY